MFAQRLKQMREELGMTQSGLAKKLNLTQSTIAYYESGQKMPTLENAKLIAEIFNTSLDYLLGINIIKAKEQSNEYIFDSNQLLNDIQSLSIQSLEDLKTFLDFLKYRDSKY